MAPSKVILCHLRVPYTDIVHCVVWTLRVWKIHMLEIAKLTKEEGEGDIRNPDTVGAGTRVSTANHKSFSMAFAVKACFSLTKV